MSFRCCSNRIELPFFSGGYSAMAGKGLRIGEEADFEARNRLPALKLIRIGPPKRHKASFKH